MPSAKSNTSKELEGLICVCVTIAPVVTVASGMSGTILTLWSGPKDTPAVL